MRKINQQSRISNLSYHMQQFSKGVLVSIFTFAGYGLAKRFLGDATKAQDTDSQDQALIISSRKSSAEVTFKLSPNSSLNYFLKSETLHNAYRSQETSLADEYEVSFHEKERKPILIMHTINPDNPDPEEMRTVVGEEFRIEIPGYKVGTDGKTYYFSNLKATLIDGSPLPAWMRLEPPQTPFVPNVIAMLNTGGAGGMVIKENIVFLAAYTAGLQLVNISDPYHPKLISRLPSKLRGVVVQNDLALLAADDLLVVNVSDPRHPLIISNVQFKDYAWNINKRGNIALVAARSDGLQLVDISDPRHPKIVAKQSFPGFAVDIAIQGDIALVAADNAGLQLVNISDAHHPGIISGKSLPGYASGVTVQKDLAIVVTYNDGAIHLVNISNPRHLKIISSQFIASPIYSATVQGDWVLAATSTAGLQIIDISHPAFPRIIGQLKTNSETVRALVKRNLAVVACTTSLRIIDLKNWAWILKGTPPIAERGLIQTVLLQSNILPDVIYNKILRFYSTSRPHISKPVPNLNIKPGQVFSYRFASEFFDAGDETLPFEKLEFNQAAGALPSWLSISYEPLMVNQRLPDYARAIAVQGKIALVATSSSGLQLIDIGDPTRPITISNQMLPGVARAIAVKKNVAIVATSKAGLQFVNISDLWHPKVIGNLSLPGSAIGVSLLGNVALIAAEVAGLQLVNISDFCNPKVISSQSLPGSALNVIVQGNVALVAANAALVLVNISNPQYPKIIGSLPPSDFTMDVAVQKNVVAIADYRFGLQLANISNPKFPKTISRLPLLGDATLGVSIQGNIVFVADGSAGLQLVNIHRTQDPIILDSIEIMGGAFCVTPRNGSAYVGTTLGLTIIQFGLSGGVLRAQPSKADHNNYQIIITARNSDGIVGNTTFMVSVNNPPVWKTAIARKTVNVGQLASFQLPRNVFWDEDGDTFTFSSELSNGSPLPDWITFFAEGRIYTIIPSSINRGRYNISVSVDDGFYGTAQAWFLLTVPTRKPIKISDIPSQNAFIWRSFELLVSAIFVSPDGDALSYRAQLKGARPLPGWLQFDNSTCITSCHFIGNPGVTDLTDLEVELIATGLGGEANAEFSISMRNSTLFQDLATYYSVSGAGLVVLGLLERFWRWKKMRGIHADLSSYELVVDDGEAQVNAQSVRDMLQNLLRSVEQRELQVVKNRIQAYRQSVLCYVKQQQSRLLEIEDPWAVIEKISKEIGRRAQHRLGYSETLSWIEILHQLLQLIIETEEGYGRAILKTNKETLLELLAKVEKYIQSNKKHGVQIKHQLQLCREALVSMDDTDSIIDNLYCRDSDMLLEVIKTMVAPPYGMIRLMYQHENIPSGWYPIIIQMCHLADKALTNSEKLSELQTTLSQQKDWCVVYEGVGLLGKVARETQDEKIQKQTVEGIQGQTRGLNYYQNYYGFWGRCSPCCDRQSAWIRAHAQAEVKSIDQDAQEVDVGVSMNSLRQPLLQIQ